MNKQIEKVVFSGGCFWCTEAVFKMIRGVSSVLPGYTGGEKPNPIYDEVCSGKTGHAEGVEIEYDPSLINFKDLLVVFFGSHDSTTLNRQGNDVGTQYRSAIFYTTNEQKEKSEEFIKEINESVRFGNPVVTTVGPLDIFYPAENYHKDYYAQNKNNSYCAIVINPKLDKVQKQFADLIKKTNA